MGEINLAQPKRFSRLSSVLRAMPKAPRRFRLVAGRRRQCRTSNSRSRRSCSICSTWKRDVGERGRRRPARAKAPAGLCTPLHRSVHSVRADAAISGGRS